MKFLVLIRAPDDACRRIYGKLGKPLSIEGGSFVQISCDQLVSDVHYVQARLLLPPNKKGLVVWLPHFLVVAVYSGDQTPKIGFGDA